VVLQEMAALRRWGTEQVKRPGVTGWRRLPQAFLVETSLRHNFKDLGMGKIRLLQRRIRGGTVVVALCEQCREFEEGCLSAKTPSRTVHKGPPGWTFSP
jgi:hypothetical protein